MMIRDWVARLGIVALLLGGIAALSQAQVTVNPPLGLPSASGYATCTAAGVCTVSKVLGTATNNNAAVGDVGEYVRASSAETNQAQSGATVTITNASPAVVTWSTTIPYVTDASHSTCTAVNFTTDGALPTGLVVGTNYFVIGSSISGNTFRVATTIANCIAGTAVNTSSAGSGTHTGNPTILLSFSASPSDFGGFSLTAGDWDINVNMVFLTATTTSVTTFKTQWNTASVTSTVVPSQFGLITYPSTVIGAANTALHAGPARATLSGTTTIFCGANSTFTVSTVAAWGSCNARRAR